MELKMKIEYMVSIMVLFACLLSDNVLGESQVPCYFIFGDSLSDNGNNNNLVTLAKVNFSPYGTDFQNGPTGRFTNGRTMVDITAELLGFKNSPPPFATAKGTDFLLGVNYASGSAGIRNETGKNLGDNLSLDDQLKNHEITISKMMFKLFKNTRKTTEHLNKCLYYVGMGSNDYINNYLLPHFFTTSRQYTPQQYATALIEQYSQQIKTLYNYGARKVVLSGLGSIGCIPFEIATHGSKNGAPCVDHINFFVQLFNKKLISLVDQLNNNFTDAKFIYINLYDLSMQVMANPSRYGFKVADKACCRLGENNVPILCSPLSIPCKNRSEYMFWDGFHLTEASYLIAASRAYKASTSTDAYPFDIQHLVQFDLTKNN